MNKVNSIFRNDISWIFPIKLKPDVGFIKMIIVSHLFFLHAARTAKNCCCWHNEASSLFDLQTCFWSLVLVFEWSRLVGMGWDFGSAPL